MLLDIVVLVLRETLEASVFIGILISLSRHSKIKLYWLFYALLLGASFALLYGRKLIFISEMFDYAGQEALNATIQYLLFIVSMLIVRSQFKEHAVPSRVLELLMVVAVTLAVTREGSELYVFYSGYFAAESSVLRGTTVGFIGLAVGMSAGAVAYYFLVTRQQDQARRMHSVALALIASGMVLQATQLLVQVDWLPAGSPIWDSNWLLPESSVVGQVLYALFGYESTPSGFELSAYILALLLMIAAALTANVRLSFFARIGRE